MTSEHPVGTLSGHQSGASTPDAVSNAIKADLSADPGASDSLPSGEGPNPDEDAVKQAAQDQESDAKAQPSEEDAADAEDAEAALAQPFEILIWFPARPLLPAHAIAAGLPDTPSPLRCAVTPSENLNDLRATIQDSPEGYWLGAFCFRLRTSSADSSPAEGSSDSGATKNKKKGGAEEEEVVTLGQRLGEWTELSTIFEGIPQEKRQLAITHVEYNESDARTHVQRLRELLHSGYRDPLALGIDAGITVLDAVRHPAEWEKESNQAITAASLPQNNRKKHGGNQADNGTDESTPHKATGAALFSEYNPAPPTDGSSLPDLVPAHARPARYFPTSLRHLSVAAWSPPPHHLRIQAGHLLYLHVVTLEGETHFITACTRGFYVNRCTATKFDPSPRTAVRSNSNKPEFASCSLFDVLCALSPLFLTNFAKLFNDPLSARDYYAAIPCSNCLPAFPWLAREIPGSSTLSSIPGSSNGHFWTGVGTGSSLSQSNGHAHGSLAAPSSSSSIVTSPTAAGLSHVYDPLRSQSAYLLTGATSPDQLEGTRDWNDELQSTREIPRTTLPERLVRERVLSRAFSDFLTAAVRVVPRVAAGMVPAMNPMDPPSAQMFIVNNLFISKGVDGVDLYPHLGGDEAAHVAVSKDVHGVRTLNALDIDGVCLLGTVVVDWMGERWVAQSVVPGLFRRKDEDEEDEEAATVGKGDAAVNGTAKAITDGKEEVEEAKAVTAADAKAIDAAKTETAKKDGKLQELHEDTQVIYGGVEGPEIIRTHKGFHKIFAKVAASLHLALHKVPDGEGQEHELWLSVESKGLRGADGRKYALDLARLNPVDVLWLENDIDGPVMGHKGDQKKANGEDLYPHRMALLRPELLEIFWDDSFRKWARNQVSNKDQKQVEDADKKAEEGAKDGAEGEEKPRQAERIDTTRFSLAYNPDAFVEFRVPDTEANAAAEVSEEGDAEEQPAKTKVVVLVKDESDPTVAAVRNAATFLREVTIPRLLTDVATGVFAPADGAALTLQLHTRGINVRYLGYLARLANPDTYAASDEEASKLKAQLDAGALSNAGPGYEGPLKCFESVVLQEMVVRASKRILRSLLRQVGYAEAANVISHFLNCLLGTAVEPHPKPVGHTSPLAEGFDGGVYDEVSTSQEKDNTDEMQSSKLTPWHEITPEVVREQVQQEIRRRYRFELPTNYVDSDLRKPQALRELCQRCGIQLKLQSYYFELEKGASSSAPAQNGNAEGSASQLNGAASDDSHGEGAHTPTTATAAKKKNKKKKSFANGNADSLSGSGIIGAHQSRIRATTFEPEDILNLVPVIKDSAPKSTLAEEAFEAGRLSLGRGDRDLGIDLLLEGINFHEQVYGVVHPEVSRCYSLFAMYVHHFTTLAAIENTERVRKAQAAGKEPTDADLLPVNEHLTLTNAVRYQRMAVTISERTLGLDNPETVTQYLNLAILERADGNHDASLQCLNRVLELWYLIYGPNHVELITVLNATALTLQHARRMEASLKLYQSAHALALKTYGPDNIQVGHLTHELSQAYALVADLKTALTLAKESCRIFEARLGKEDSQTREAELYLSSLAASAVRHAKVEMEAKKREARFAAMGLQVQPGLANRAAQMRLQYGQPGAGGSAGSSKAAASVEDDAGRSVAAPSAASANSTVDPSLSLDELVSYINSGSANGAGSGKGKGKASVAAQSAKKSRR
ncbi:Intracellular distribution of mitochondria [Tilletia horrida]|nr:Intracellular distribution of mitochondria [Tilletia horrida]